MHLTWIRGCPVALALCLLPAASGQSIRASVENAAAAAPNPAGGKKDAHLAVAAGIGALFAVDTGTGVWNLIEARKNPNHRKRRLLHGLLMLGPDAGFVTTAALGPDTEYGAADDCRAAHAAPSPSPTSARSSSAAVRLDGATIVFAADRVYHSDQDRSGWTAAHAELPV
jgi:hypothetical protein